MAAPWFIKQENGFNILVDETTIAPSPSKDYCQILVTTNQVIYRCWKVSMRVDAKSAVIEIKNNYEDFLDDNRVHSEIRRSFGEKMFVYVRDLALGHIDYLSRLSDQTIVNIVRHLPLEDINQLSYTSKQFHRICNSEELWKEVYILNNNLSADQVKSVPTNEITELADKLGWKRLLFTNKLQLQVLLRRQMRQHKASGDGCHDDESRTNSSAEPDQTGSGDAIDTKDESAEVIEALTRSVSNISTNSSVTIDTFSSSSSCDSPRINSALETVHQEHNESSSSSSSSPLATVQLKNV